MSASKKKTTTAKSSPAPATQRAASGRKPAARKAAPAAKPSAPASKPAAPVALAAPVSAPAVVRPAVVPTSITTISAQVDVGFGNTLYIRGSGGGLSWSVGLPMNCVAADLWRISLDAARQDIAFKVLVNDLTWNTGPDFAVAAGTNVTVKPGF
jgi:hypothetical protein